MNRIDTMFAEKKRSGGKAFIPYVTAGHPDLAATEAVVPLLADCGADLIELGIPFSDPIADGPTIQAAMSEALRGGTKTAGILESVRKIRERTDVPMIFMSACNPLIHYGLERFADDARDAGIDGFLVPDMPPEESAGFETICRERDLPLIYLVAPTTPPDRRQSIGERSRGFIYYISLKGVTGARQALAADLAEGVREMRNHTDLPICVGFGVSTPDQVRQVIDCADGVIVGSAIVRKLGELHGDPDWQSKLREFVIPLIDAAHGT